MPETFGKYKEAAQDVDSEDGCILSLVTQEEERKNEMLHTAVKKMKKAFGRDDLVRCLPILWHEVSRLKSRVEQVLKTLSNKRVRNEKVVEFKKQVVSNKSLKEYFKQNPKEKEILQNDIEKNVYTDKVLFKSLDTLPFYAIPKEILATTPEQIKMCTSGSDAYIPDWISGQ
mmetsp:Transcript_19401/g.29792  ORF Transcript_19401/g.29792 Transcript_19401/m.29792 type:complete len:172 (-) Transcript_19401:342-857(-)